MLQKSCSNARQLMYVLNGLPHSFHLSCANSSRGFVIQGSTSRRLMNCGCRRRPQFPCRRRIVFTNIHTHTHTHTRLFTFGHSRRSTFFQDGWNVCDVIAESLDLQLHKQPTFDLTKSITCFLDLRYFPDLLRAPGSSCWPLALTASC